MNRLSSAIIALVVLAALATSTAAQPAPQSQPQDFVSGEILVKFQPGTPGQAIANIHKQNGGQVIETIPGIGVQVVRVPVGEETARAAIYQHNPNVEFAELNGLVYEADMPNDPRVGEQWQYNNTSQTGGTYDADIDAFEAWDVATGSESVAIAILDTGIDSNHVDFHYGGADNLQYSKIRKSANFTTSSTVEDVRGHGTHVAGTVAAGTDNGRGVAGTCPSCVLYNGKVLGDDGSGAWSWVANGITWATDNGAQVINMSLSGSSGSRTLRSAVDYAWNNNVVIVAAAGNNGSSTPRYPAYYSNVIAVAATDHNDDKASFSNYGSWVDVAAPGVNILSTTVDDTYGTKSGTSMATPHVAGLAGLLWSTGYGTTNSAVRNQLEGAADAIDGTGSSWTHGRINACQAVGGACDGTSSGPGVTIVNPASGTETADDSAPMTIQVQVSSPDAAGTAQVDVSIDGGAWQPTAYNSTADRYEWQWNLSDAANGPHTIRALATDSTGTTTTDPALVRLAKPVALPGSFEAEDYRPGGQDVGYSDANPENLGGAYWNDGVDKESCADSSTCYNVGWTEAGEWLAYDVSVAQAGDHVFTFRVAAPHTDTTIGLELIQAGAIVATTTISVPNTGGWQTWADVASSAVAIDAGSYTLKLVAGFTGSNPGYLYNLNYVTVTSSDTPPANAAPVAVDDTYSTTQDTSLNISAPGVLANDTDADGDPISAILVTGPANGTLDLNPDGSFTYSPVTGYNGSDSFTYKANDGTLDSNPATVSISIGAVNQPPTASFTFSCTELTCSFSAAGSTDPDGTIASYSWQFGDGTSGSGVDTSHTYAIADSYEVTLTVTDDGGETGSSSQTVTVTAPTTEPTSLHVGDLDGSSTSLGSSWTASVTITVHDNASHTPVEGATVSGSWTWNGSSSTGTCVTGANGTCTLNGPTVHKRVSSVTFTVLDVSGSLPYAPGDNHDPDNDSNGTTIVVLKP